MPKYWARLRVTTGTNYEVLITADNEEDAWDRAKEGDYDDVLSEDEDERETIEVYQVEYDSEDPENPREKGDDDGVEYGDPRDEIDERNRD